MTVCTTLPLKILSSQFSTREGVFWLFVMLFCLPVSKAEETHQTLTFEKDIRPILRAHCLDCHGATDDLSGGLDLRQVRRMLTGGDSGPAIRIGQSEDSLLMVRIASGEMPPGEAKVTPRERDLLTRWLQQGAKTSRPEPETIAAGVGITPEERAFWSFQPIVRHAEPLLRPEHATRSRTPIDAFVLSQMPEGLTFGADADRHTLILRAHFDLIGLPPTSEMLQHWLNDPSGEWYSRMIESLLANPAYGERWARHWLDVAGYADSDGFTVSDPERPWAWKYRDYVIRSINADKPFNRFIHEQIAGDELAGPQQGDLTPEQIELLSATGFLRTAADGTGSGEDHPTGRNQVIGDTLKIVGTSLLGLSIGCAQCHDHRYDPIPQTDYFALRAVFAPAMDWQNWRVPSQRLVSLYTDADRKKSAEISAEAAKIGEDRTAKEKEYMAKALEAELQKYEEPLRASLKAACETAADKRSPEQNELLRKYPSVNISPGVLYQYLPDAAEDLKKYDARIAEVNAKRPPEEFLAVLNEPAGHFPETRLFYRGDFQHPKELVTPAALTAACPEDQRVEFPVDDPSLPTSGRRLAFTKWLTDRSNPLVARVLVNRIWMHHFGRGIVASPADFGRLGVAPSHPALLDWLADELMQSGWSLKHMHRLILSSTVWRQSSRRESMHDTLDPDNALYSRQLIRRLDAELVRDRMLAATGQLSSQQFGPPAALKEDDAGQVLIDDNESRRSLYIKVRRSQPVAMLQAFDAPVMEVNCERRPVSTVATQSLMLMNSLSVLHHASKLAEKAHADAVAIPDDLLTALPQLPALPTDTWQYGYGSYNDATKQVDQFTRLTHFSGSMWQAGPAVPDAVLGYVLLRAEGGHPDQPGREVIRRWIAPKSGTVSITGKLAHGSENGDGVRGRILTSRPVAGGSPLLLEQMSFNNSTDTVVNGVIVNAGDLIDFVVDCRTAHTSDSFQWAVQINLAAADGSTQRYDSAAGFRGPSDPPRLIAGQIQSAWKLAYGRHPDADELPMAMDFLAEQINYLQHNRDRIPHGLTETQQAMVNLCQALITSNEFLYVK
ncbi:MAG: PSD1 and planctomycete cytochrome C domain-containing protein [Planctomycetota bacterium]